MALFTDKSVRDRLVGRRLTVVDLVVGFLQVVDQVVRRLFSVTLNATSPRKIARDTVTRDRRE